VFISRRNQEIREHDPHRAACFVQMRGDFLKQVDDGIYDNPRMMSNVKWVFKDVH